MRYNNRSIDITNNVIYGWGWFEGGAAGLDLPSDPGYSPSINVENNIYHYVQSKGSEDNAILFDARSFPGDIFFSGNQLPVGENDAVSTSAQIPIPAYATVVKLDTNSLADAVVPCAGTRFPNGQEQVLLATIQEALGSSSSTCQPDIRPRPPTDLSVSQ
jgi:hypothetical protein